MKICEPLNGLQLDVESEKTIEIINSKKEISDILAAFITLGFFRVYSQKANHHKQVSILHKLIGLFTRKQ